MQDPKVDPLGSPISIDVKSEPLDVTPIDVVNGEFGPTFGPPDTVGDALAKALEAATVAQRWDVVAQLARELESRRIASTNVTIGNRKHGAK